MNPLLLTDGKVSGVYKSCLEKAAMVGHQDFSWELSVLQSFLGSEKSELQSRVTLETQQVLQVNSLLTQLISMAG